MNIPVSKLVGVGGRGDEAQNERWNAELSPASPAPSAPVPPALARTDGSPRGAGFTSVIRHLSLRGWLRWIHSNRSDATLRVRTPENGSGTIWCSRGEIIDAEWDGRVAEEALREMLPLGSGAVTIDFTPVQHPARFRAKTQELLQEADAGASREAELQTALADSRTTPARGDHFSELALLLAGSLAPSADSGAPPPSPARRVWRRDYVLGALLVGTLAVAGFTCGRLRASGEPEADLAARNAAPAEPRRTEPQRVEPRATAPAPAAPTSAAPPQPSQPAPPPVPASGAAPEPSALAPIPFVAIEVEPRTTQIWLDRQLAGTGRIELGAIHDGMLHELRFMAPGYETKTLFFRDAPPAGRVLLKRVPSSAGVAAEGPAATAEALPSITAEQSAEPERESAAPDVPRRAVRRRAAPPPPAPPPARAQPVAESPPPAAPPAAKKAPRVELIEVQTPRVQVVD
jgi:hypothetical protein